jgi:aminoglycoside phosphotransferase (APT) family kinase protein
VLGHGDWEPHNLRFDDERISAVFDWDSTVALPEAAVAWVAGVWLLAHEAKGEQLSGVDGALTRQLRAEGDERLARAGA